MDRTTVIGQAQAALVQGRQADALDLLLPYIQLYPMDGWANTLAAVAYAQQEKYTEAEPYFRTSLAIDPNQYEVTRMMIRVLIELRKWDEALPLAEEARKAFPNDSVLKVELESIKDNIEMERVGWERRMYPPGAHVEIAGDH